MTQEETIQYNKRCVDLLPFNYRNQSKYWIIYKYDDNSFFGKNRRYLAVNNLKFHSDWNWIMEVVEAIEKLGYESLIGGGEYYYPEKGMRYIQSFIKDEITIHEEAKTKKEAVVQAINQFLIWYEQQNK